MRYSVVLVHRPKNLVSKGNRKFTHSYWNHGGIYCHDTGKVLEAVSPKIREHVNYNMFIEHYLRMDSNCEFKTCESFESVLTFEEFTNKPYQLWVFISQPTYYFLAFEFGKTHWLTTIFNNAGNDDKYFCFELCGLFKGVNLPHLADGRYFDLKDEKGLYPFNE